MRSVIVKQTFAQDGPSVVANFRRLGGGLFGSKSDRKHYEKKPRRDEMPEVPGAEFLSQAARIPVTRVVSDGPYAAKASFAFKGISHTDPLRTIL
jgi:hypothetical protein